MTIKESKSRGREERPLARPQVIRRLLVSRLRQSTDCRAALCPACSLQAPEQEHSPVSLIQVRQGSSGQFADDSNEGGVLILEPLVVCSEVPQNLDSRTDRK